ncbi:MAG TPA: sigma-54 dependent transcriptional regulator [Pyrinomonadaceae bacterium]|jgi:DNA-binding NtrC family response regulator|nr:sigma-54 dependent transcriptional regulator [Pyrinomonadaceae bacterium]
MIANEGALQALVIDDEHQVREFVSDVLRDEGWNVTQSPSAEDAFERIHQALWSVVFCDVMLGGANGFSVLRHFKEKMPEAKVVLMTGHGTAAGALDATAFGAYDYLLKPFGPEELQSLSRALREQLSERPQRSSPARRAAAYHSDIELVGRSQAFIEVMKQVGRVANTNLPVLLTGESGTGKELVASAIHHRSGRSAQPFVAVNCGAIPAELIEAELFGHVKGSFTGADRDRRGLWEEADGGTVFLDEITETNSSFQVKLLRALQMGEIRRVGSNQTQKVNVRVLAASNRNVEQEVAAGRFRNDLFYRLNAVSIVLPPLRERREDIPPLAQTFADRVYSLSPSVKFSSEALALLERYNWPGNIRELENAVVRAVAMCDGTIRVKDLPQRVRNHMLQPADAGNSEHSPAAEPVNEDWVTLSEIEGRYVTRVLEHTGGNKQAAARVLAVDRKTLDRMIKRHHINSHHARGQRVKVSGRG